MDRQQRQAETVTATWRTQHADGQGEEGAGDHQRGDTQDRQRDRQAGILSSWQFAGGRGGQSMGWVDRDRAISEFPPTFPRTWRQAILGSSILLLLSVTGEFPRGTGAPSPLPGLVPSTPPPGTEEGRGLPLCLLSTPVFQVLSPLSFDPSLLCLPVTMLLSFFCVSLSLSSS